MFIFIQNLPPPLVFLGGCHRHGSPDGPADPPGPAGRLVAPLRGGLHRAGGQRSRQLPGYVLPAADQRHAPAGELIMRSGEGRAPGATAADKIRR